MSTILPNADPTPTPQPKKRKAKPNALADVLRDWESLLSAVADHAADLPGVASYGEALATSLEKVKAAKNLQESHAASKQTSTQSLQEVVMEGKDQAIRLRWAIRAGLGPTTQMLTQFGIPPLRRRPLRHKQPDTPEPAPQPEVTERTEGVRSTP
jgi:hypothetical protein